MVTSHCSLRTFGPTYFQCNSLVGHVGMGGALCVCGGETGGTWELCVFCTVLL